MPFSQARSATEELQLNFLALLLQNLLGYVK